MDACRALGAVGLASGPVLADEEVDPRARANGDAKNGEAPMEPPPPDAPALVAEKLDVAAVSQSSCAPLQFANDTHQVPSLSNRNEERET